MIYCRSHGLVDKCDCDPRTLPQAAPSEEQVIKLDAEDEELARFKVYTNIRVSKEMIDPIEPYDPIPTVSEMLGFPDMVQRRLLDMADHRIVADAMLRPDAYPLPRPRWRQRLRTALIGPREWLAFRIAPWLDSGSDW